jgi:acyl dehydratase
MARVGHSLGASAWVTVTQELVTQFAGATGDEQWRHVDQERAGTGPFGACVAHGHLTLSLAGGRFFHELVHTSAAMGINYGCDRVRFPAPVRVGARIRGNAHIVAGHKVGEDGVQLTVRMTVEVEHEQRPACVADLLSRYFFKNSR